MADAEALDPAAVERALTAWAHESGLLPDEIDNTHLTAIRAALAAARAGEPAPMDAEVAAAERTEGECVFCEIAAGRAPAQIISDGPSSVAIAPLNPVTPGHALFIPRQHVRDAYTIPRVTAQTVKDAISWARRDPRYAAANLITSVGAAATQSVYHLHVHVVPRTSGDGLALPWTEVTP